MFLPPVSLEESSSTPALPARKRARRVPKEGASDFWPHTRSSSGCAVRTLRPVPCVARRAGAGPAGCLRQVQEAGVTRTQQGAGLGWSCRQEVQGGVGPGDSGTTCTVTSRLHLSCRALRLPPAHFFPSGASRSEDAEAETAPPVILLVTAGSSVMCSNLMGRIPVATFPWKLALLPIKLACFTLRNVPALHVVSLGMKKPLHCRAAGRRHLAFRTSLVSFSSLSACLPRGGSFLTVGS